MELVAVVLAGGTGTRLYPASRPDRPKQFRAFGGDRSLLRRTVDRLGFADEVCVLTGPDHEAAVREHAPEATVLVEPAARDTGPALAYAAHELRDRAGDVVLLCLPSDHHVGDGFERVARRAARVATGTEGLVTIGVEPTRPATGYGYLEPGDERQLADGTAYRGVRRFVEKPDPETAARFCRSGCYWNTGMFAWTPAAFLGAARDSPLAPVLEHLEAGEAALGFAAVDPISVDRAVMEGADETFLVPAAFEWDDLGSWDALARVLDADADGNVVLGDARARDASDCILSAGGEMVVDVIGTDGLVVAAHDDRVVVVPRDETQLLRAVAAERDSGPVDGDPDGD